MTSDRTATLWRCSPFQSGPTGAKLSTQAPESELLNSLFVLFHLTHDHSSYEYYQPFIH